MKKVSIAICCYNEEENVQGIYDAVKYQMELIQKYDYEIIFSDNDSADKTQSILRTIAEKDKKVKVIFNNKNFGPERSCFNCMINSSGEACLAYSSDFQDPPELIPEFIQYWEEGYKVVWGEKIKSEENKIKYMMRRLFYFIMEKISKDPIYRQVTGFGLYDREVLEQYRMCEECDMSIRYFVPQMGWKVKLIPYIQPKRRGGRSSYNISRYFDFAISSLIQNSEVPLRVATLLGTFTSLVSFTIGVTYLIYKLINWDTFAAGTAPVAIGLFFLGSVQLLFLGIIGEYIGKILRKVTVRPAVIEKERINFD